MRHLQLLVAALALTACQRGAATSTGQRVVCVSKQINEYMFDIRAESVLVGRDLTSVYPAQIKRIPSVGYHRALSAEGIISLRPTMFLTDGNVGPQSVLDQLRKVGIPVVVMDPGTTPDSAEQLMSRLGRAFHHERDADSTIAAWRQGMADALADTVRWSGQRKLRVLVMHFGQLVNDYLAVNRGSPADQMIRWAGGVNAVDSVGGMTRLTPELIAKAAPDIIVATDLGFDRLGGVAQFAALPGVSLTPAGRSRRIYRVDETEVMYYGPRTPATVRKLAAMFHPDTVARR